MALRGSLRDLGISEILQMIGHQKKSGVIEIQGKSRSIKILFDSGSIVASEMEPINQEYELTTILVKSGLITPSQMKVAQRQASESLQPVEVILLNSKAISLDDLKEMISLKTLEIIYDLFLWDEGEYSFNQQSVNYPQQLVRPLSCEQVLMDGYRIKDEWPEVNKWLPDIRMRLEKSGTGSTKAKHLSGELDRVYSLVNGERTGLDIAFVSRRGRFETAKALVDLMERGLVALVEDEMAPLEGATTSRALEIPVYILFVILVILFLVGAWRNMVRFENLLRGPTKDHKELVENMELPRLEYALEVYKLLNGEYPRALSDLISHGILKKEELIGPWGAAYIYKSTQEGYVLHSPVMSGSPE